MSRREGLPGMGDKIARRVSLGQPGMGPGPIALPPAALERRIRMFREVLAVLRELARRRNAETDGHNGVSRSAYDQTCYGTPRNIQTSEGPSEPYAAGGPARRDPGDPGMCPSDDGG